jgi:multiple sugar transport system substrate-binding protein
MEDKRTGTDRAAGKSPGNLPDLASLSRRLSRREVLLAGGVAAAAGLVGCGGSSSGSKSKSGGGSGSAANLRGTTITLMTFELFEQQEITAWRKVVHDFTAKTGIKVKWTGWPFSTYDTNVVQQAQAGSLDADVVMCTPEAASSLIVNYQNAVPLEDVAKSVDLVPNPAHDQFRINGHLYALGFLEVAFVNAYNEAVLKAAGVKQPPTTLDEWIEASQKVTSPPKKFGNFLINNVTGNGSDMWNQLQNFPLGFGGVWAKDKTLMIDSPENIKAMEYWVELVKASGINGTSEVALQKLWFDARLGMSLQVAAGSASLKTIAPKLYPDLRSAAPPWPGNKAVARLHPLVVPKSSKKQEAALALVKWIIQPKNLFYVTIQNGYPIVPYTNFGDLVPAYNKYEAGLPWGQGFKDTNYIGEYDLLGQYTAAYAQVGQIVCTSMEPALSGSTSVAQALKNAQGRAQSSIHV